MQAGYRRLLAGLTLWLVAWVVGFWLLELLEAGFDRARNALVSDPMPPWQLYAYVGGYVFLLAAVCYPPAWLMLQQISRRLLWRAVALAFLGYAHTMMVLMLMGLAETRLSLATRVYLWNRPEVDLLWKTAFAALLACIPAIFVRDVSGVISARDGVTAVVPVFLWIQIRHANLDLQPQAVIIEVFPLLIAFALVGWQAARKKATGNRIL